MRMVWTPGGLFLWGNRVHLPPDREKKERERGSACLKTEKFADFMSDREREKEGGIACKSWLKGEERWK